MALGDKFGPEDYGCYTEEPWEFVKAERALLKMEEELKRWCPSSGENVGKLISIPGSDDHKIQAPPAGPRGTEVDVSCQTIPGNRKLYGVYEKISDQPGKVSV